MRTIRRRTVRRALAASLLLAPLLLAAERPPLRPTTTTTRVSDEQIDRIVDGLRLKFAGARRAGAIPRSSGTRAVVLDEERVHFATAQIGADGRPVVGCSKGARAAVRAAVEPATVPAKE